jgi:hypothetical protein
MQKLQLKHGSSAILGATLQVAVLLKKEICCLQVVLDFNKTTCGQQLCVLCVLCV